MTTRVFRVVAIRTQLAPSVDDDPSTYVGRVGCTHDLECRRHTILTSHPYKAGAEHPRYSPDQTRNHRVGRGQDSIFPGVSVGPFKGTDSMMSSSGCRFLASTGHVYRIFRPQVDNTSDNTPFPLRLFRGGDTLISSRGGGWGRERTAIGWDEYDLTMPPACSGASPLV